MLKSLWDDQVKLPQFPKLEGDMKKDVLIIGGGMCGILSAYFLDWAGVDYCLLEADNIGGGVTNKTTAKISALQGLTYDNLIKKAGNEEATLYLKSCLAAIERYSSIANNIDCDFEYRPAYTFSLNDRKKIEDEVRAIRSIGGEAEVADKTELPFQTMGMVKMSHQAEFNPLKFISGISKDLKIYENSRVLNIDGKTAKTKDGSVTAETIIVATHFPFINKKGLYPLKLYQSRAYTIGIKNAPKVEGMYLDENPKGISMRSYKDILLISGSASRTGRNTEGWEKVRSFAKQYYPEAEEMYTWATQDCMSLDGMPYIGKYSKGSSRMYVATGFNKWGMTASMTSAMLIRDMIFGRKNDFERLFSPQRGMLHRQLLYNGAEAVRDLLTPGKKRCPHLGCGLCWNSFEHTWDCPCHGSRFSKKGVLLDNPSNKRLEN